MGMAWARKPEIVVLNKADAIPKAALAKKRASLEKVSGQKVLVMSGCQRRRRRRCPCRFGAQSGCRPKQGTAQIARAAELGAVTDHLAKAKRIVVKVGSALLVDSAAGTLKREWLASLAADIAALKQDQEGDHHPSPPVRLALGRRALKLKSSILRLEESQAAAAVGQGAARASLCRRIPWP
jgi:hypothetical protein